MVGETLYLLLLLGMVPLKGNWTGRCHPGPNNWALNAYRWGTTRDILVSDKSRRVSGTDDVRAGNWSGSRKALPITLRSHLSLSLTGWTFSGKRVGKQGTGKRWEQTFCTLHRIPVGGLDDA